MVLLGSAWICTRWIEASYREETAALDSCLLVLVSNRALKSFLLDGVTGLAGLHYGVLAPHSFSTAAVLAESSLEGAVGAMPAPPGPTARTGLAT